MPEEAWAAASALLAYNMNKHFGELCSNTSVWSVMLFITTFLAVTFLVQVFFATRDSYLGNSVPVPGGDYWSHASGLELS